MAKTAYLAHPVNLGAFLLEVLPKHHLIKHLAKMLLVRFLYESDLCGLALFVVAFCLLDIVPFGYLAALDRCIGFFASPVRGHRSFLVCSGLRQKWVLRRTCSAGN